MINIQIGIIPNSKYKLSMQLELGAANIFLINILSISSNSSISFSSYILFSRRNRKVKSERRFQRFSSRTNPELVYISSRILKPSKLLLSLCFVIIIVILFYGSEQGQVSPIYIFEVLILNSFPHFVEFLMRLTER